MWLPWLIVAAVLYVIGGVWLTVGSLVVTALVLYLIARTRRRHRSAN
jgi:hypothetical protein